MKGSLIIVLKILPAFTLSVLLSGIADPVSSQTKWYKYPGNPVIEPETIKDWDYTIKPNAVLYDQDRNEYNMWYKGWDLSNNVAFGYAKSTDGINWEKYKYNPIEFNCEGNSWEAWIGSIAVIKKDSVFYMWYSGGSKEDSTSCIGFAWSSDGITWTKHPDPVLKPSKEAYWEAGGCAGPRVLFNKGRYHLWYNGNAGGIPVIGRTGYATSEDGMNWKKYSGNPVLDVGDPGSWEDHSAMVEAVIFNGSNFEMWYHGWNLVQHELGYATSLNGISWNKFPKNPVLRAGNVGEWDSWLTTYPAVLKQDSIYKMWYYGHDNTRGRVGYATTSLAEVNAWDTIQVSKSQRTIRVQVFNRTEFIKVDSIADKLPELSGIELVNACNKLALAYALNDVEKCLNYATKAIDLAEQEIYPQGKAMALYSTGISQYVADNYSDALVKQLEALHLFDSLEMIFEKGNLLSLIASIHAYTGSYDLACRYHNKALDAYEKLNDTGCILSSLNYLGYSMLFNGDTIDAIRVFQERRRLTKEKKYVWNRVRTLEALGLCYTGHKLDSALYYFKRAASIWDTLRQVGYHNYNFLVTAEAYFAEGLKFYNLAEEYYLKSYKISGNARQNQVRLLYGLAELYFATGRYDKCRKDLEVALNMCRNFLNKQNHQMFANLNEKLQYEMYLKPYMGKIYWLNYRLDTALKNEKSAFEYYKLATHWKDSIINQQNKRQWAMMQGQYETERSQSKIAVLESENEVKDLRLKQSGIVLLVLGVFILILILGAVVFIHNRKLKAQHALEVQQVKTEKLQELDRLKSQFFANISHEFRTPLTLIMRPLEKLLSKTHDEKDIKELSIARKYAQSLQSLINNLLSLSRLESGKMHLHAKEINLVKFVNGYFQAFESLAKQKNITVNFTATREEIKAFIDKEKFEQILNNLLSNAFKFTDSGGRIAVAVGSRQFPLGSRQLAVGKINDLPIGSSTDQYVEIKVSDTGRGIAPEHLPHVYDRYYQGEEEKNHFEGTGIGLALTKELVELHRGTIKVQSQLGKGSVFTIFIPLGKDHLKPEEIAMDNAKERIPPDLQPLKSDVQSEDVAVTEENIDNDDIKPILLVAEDNIDMRAYIRECFEHEYKIIEAVDGRDGYKKAIDKIPDFIISDVMMPNMDGIEFCTTVKTDERTSHIPVILLTARASKESRIEGLKTGADDFITKPFDGEELQLRVKNLIRQRKRTNEILERKIRKSHGDVLLDFEDSGITSMDEQFLEKVIKIVNEHYTDPQFSTKVIGQSVGLGIVQLNRKIRALTGQTTVSFIRTFRLNRAAFLIKKKSATVAEIAYDVGFNSPSYFSECFRKYFGKLPSELMNPKTNE